MIKLTGLEFGDFDDSVEGKKALRAKVSDFLESIKGEFVYCSAVQESIELRKRGLKKLISHSGDKRKLKAVYAIKDMIKTARLIDVQKNLKTQLKPQVSHYYHLKQIVKLGNEIIPFRLILEQDTNGKIFYDLSVLECELEIKTSKTKSCPKNQSGVLSLDVTLCSVGSYDNIRDFLYRQQKQTKDLPHFSNFWIEENP